METNTAKNFVLQLGSLAALYVSLPALITLLFGIITIRFPDAAAGYWEYDSAQSSIRFSLALLIVFFPTYLVLTRIVNKARRIDTGMYLVLTKWLVYLSLLVAGAILLGDLVTVLFTFFNGEITIRFLLKAATVLLIVGSAFDYYLMDARGFWKTRERLSLQIGMMASLVVIASLIAGYYTIDAPSVVREMKLDEQQVYDLQDIQWRITEHYAEKQTFPLSIDQLYTVAPLPQAPEDRPVYLYKIVDPTTVELCATFAYPSQENLHPTVKPPRLDLLEPIDMPIIYSWEHDAGEVCFERKLEI